jgi:hypothetical protein
MTGAADGDADRDAADDPEAVVSGSVVTWWRRHPKEAQTATDRRATDNPRRVGI